jgi:proton glutamate symport protein
MSSEKSVKKFKFSLSSLIFMSMGLGLLTGLFFGEMVAFLEVVGDVWIKLLQMTVLPYVMLSLILGLGRLNYSDALLLAKKGGLILLLLWGITLAVVFLFPFTFPNWESSTFFSAAMAEARIEVDFLGLYIPANPFHALANNLVPAVVLFSIALGVALIGVDRKDSMLDGMSLIIDLLTRIANFVVRLTPIGVFAIMASASGTLSFAEFVRLEVYIYSYIALSLVMSLWVLPGLVTTLTPLSYRDVVGSTKDALVTAFATGSLFVVLPILMEKSKELITRYAENKEAAESSVEVIVPASFNFPHAGKLFTLSFVLFAGWFSGYAVEVKDYPLLVGTGLASLFANVNLAVPFMLDIMRIPGDLYQLFVTTGVINGRFATLLSAMFTLTLTLLGAFSMSGLLKVRWKRVLRYIVLTVLLLGVTVIGVRTVLMQSIDNAYDKDKLIANMALMHDRVPDKAFQKDHYLSAGKMDNGSRLDDLFSKAAQENKNNETRLRMLYGHVATSSRQAKPSFGSSTATGSRLDRILKSGVIRACYNPDDVPFSYFNNSGELVGLDIELLNILAHDMKVSLEMVPSTWKTIVAQLNSGQCDIGTSQGMTPDAALQGAFTIPIMDRTLAFLVKDYKRADFTTSEAVHSLKAPRLGLVDVPYFVEFIHSWLPHAELVTINTPKEYIDKYGDKLDAYITTVEKAGAWSLLRPKYSVVIPVPDIMKFPAAFPIPQNEESLADFLKIWISIKQKDHTIQKAYDYWVLGKQFKKKQPRWSVIRDVLHWVD